MLPPELEVITEIPCYRVILKSLLKYQIQQLLSQLNEFAEEEAVILTASISDNTVSGFGTKGGKEFIEHHGDVKTRFLSFFFDDSRIKKENVGDETTDTPSTGRETQIPRHSPVQVPQRTVSSQTEQSTCPAEKQKKILPSRDRSTKAVFPILEPQRTVSSEYEPNTSPIQEPLRIVLSQNTSSSIPIQEPQRIISSETKPSSTPILAPRVIDQSTINQATPSVVQIQKPPHTFQILPQSNNTGVKESENPTTMQTKLVSIMPPTTSYRNIVPKPIVVPKLLRYHPYVTNIGKTRVLTNTANTQSKETNSILNNIVSESNIKIVSVQGSVADFGHMETNPQVVTGSEASIPECNSTPPLTSLPTTICEDDSFNKAHDKEHAISTETYDGSKRADLDETTAGEGLPLEDDGMVKIIIKEEAPSSEDEEGSTEKSATKKPEKNRGHSAMEDEDFDMGPPGLPFSEEEEEIQPSVYDKEFIDDSMLDPSLVEGSELKTDDQNVEEKEEGAPKRFKSFSEQDMQDIADKRFSNATKRNSKWGFNVFKVVRSDNGAVSGGKRERRCGASKRNWRVADKDFTEELSLSESDDDIPIPADLDSDEDWNPAKNSDDSSDDPEDYEIELNKEYELEKTVLNEKKNNQRLSTTKSGVSTSRYDVLDSDDEFSYGGRLTEDMIERDITYSGIFARKTLKRTISLMGRRKKNDRVYNNFHCCFICSRTVLHIPGHLRTHKTNPLVAEELKKENPDFRKLRALGDDKNNRNVIANQKGEFIVKRRGRGRLDISKYGPCPICREWYLLHCIKTHTYKKCGKKAPHTKDLILQSRIIAGHINAEPSKLMRKKVFTCRAMNKDLVGEIAQKDKLIVTVGENLLLRHIENKNKRCPYTSSRMRLCARLLKALRDNKEDETDMPSDERNKVLSGYETHRHLEPSCAQPSMHDMIDPKNFDKFIRSALKISIPLMDDKDDLQSNSNAIKLMHDVRRLANAKYAYLLREEEPDTAEMEKCKQFLKLVEEKWVERISKQVPIMLETLTFNQRKELITPDDVEKLVKHLINKLDKTPLVTGNFHEIVGLCQVRLLLYNKRRYKELEMISLQDYTSRQSLAGLIESGMKDLTAVEKQLPESLEVMTIHEKDDVKVIIPADLQKPLAFIASKHERNAAHIQPENDFLFPDSTPDSEEHYVHVYQNLSKLCEELKLSIPGRITSEAIRIYTATLSQLISLDRSQMDLICKHFEMTSDVQKEADHQISELEEKVHVTKLVLIKHLNEARKSKGVDLTMTIQDLVFGVEETHPLKQGTRTKKKDGANETQKSIEKKMSVKEAQALDEVGRSDMQPFDKDTVSKQRQKQDKFMKKKKNKISSTQNFQDKQGHPENSAKQTDDAENESEVFNDNTDDENSLDDSDVSDTFPVVGNNYLISDVSETCISKDILTFPKILGKSQDISGNTMVSEVGSGNEDSNTDEDSDVEEESILRDTKNPNIYIRRILKSKTTKLGKVKKLDRVFNTYQYCAACKKKITNFSQHITRNKYLHSKDPDIKQIYEEKDPDLKRLLLTKVRGKFNNINNIKTLEAGKGEFLLERRPKEELDISDYGPCPHCLLWISKSNLKGHQTNCVCKVSDLDETNESPVTPSALILHKRKKMLPRESKSTHSQESCRNLPEAKLADGVDFDHEEVIPLLENDREGSLLSKCKAKSTCTDGEEIDEHHTNVIGKKTKDSAKGLKYYMSLCNSYVQRVEYTEKKCDLIEKKLEENQIIRDKTYTNIYIRKHVNMAEESSNKEENLLNDTDKVHVCLFCSKFVTHINEHIKSHEDIEIIRKELMKARPKFIKIRNLGDDKNNRKVVANKRGELILSWNPNNDVFDAQQYGPCTNCREWIPLSGIEEHLRTCLDGISEAEKIMELTDVVLKAQVISGFIPTLPSDGMLRGVLPIVKTDPLSSTAINEMLILMLGESYLINNTANVQNQTDRASQNMLFAAKLLKNLNKKRNSSNFELWDFLKPMYFEMVTDAAFQLSLQELNNLDDLKEPLVAKKVENILRMMMNIKYAVLLKRNIMGKGIEACRTFLGLMNLKWNNRVMVLAKPVLHKLIKLEEKDLPSPESIETLSIYLKTELQAIEITAGNFMKISTLCQALLFIYNKRCLGEFDCIRLENYTSRSKFSSEISESILQDITEVERYLLTSQELMTIKDKDDKAVPIILPPELDKPLQFISSRQNREAAGVPESNTFLFANEGSQSTRAYDSLKSAYGECFLTEPRQITSLTLRKYIATLTQLVSIEDGRLVQLCERIEELCHLKGYTRKILPDSFQQMSGLDQRVYIAKLVLVLDLNIARRFKRKCLDDIELKVIMYGGETLRGEEDDITESSDEEEMDAQSNKRKKCGRESSSEEETLSTKKRVRKKRQKCNRQKWTDVEMDELNFYFKEFLDTGVTPRRKACEKYQALSKKKNGLIWKRAAHLIVKKISHMNSPKRAATELAIDSLHSS